MIEDEGKRVHGRLTFIYPDGSRQEARFDLIAGEEEKAMGAIPRDLFREAKRPGPAKGSKPARRK